MMFRFQDFDDAFRLLDDFRREVDRLYEGYGWGRWAPTRTRSYGYGWSGIQLQDTGNTYELKADLPGVRENDIELSLENNTLTLNVERAPEVPEGYTVHRQERGGWKLARSFTLPAKVDPEKVRASLTDGVLTVTVEKAPESQPRRISVTRG